MGNKPSTDSIVTLNEDDNNDDNERHIPSPKPSVSKSSSELFIKVMRQFSLPLNEDQVQELRFNLEEIVYKSGTTIMQEGSNGVGIFVIAKGVCNVIASDGKTTLRQLTQNEIFGEVSSLYGISCTCSVKVDRDGDCTALFLKISKSKQLFMITENNQIPLRQWFIQRGYLDSACLFSSHNIPRSIIQRFIPLYSLFYGWSDSALIEIIKTFPKDCIEIYQPDTYLCIEGDTIDSGAFFILNGTIQLIKQNEIFLTMNSNSKVLFHEENIFYEDAKAVYTIKILQTCQIVTLHQEYFYSVLKAFPVECAKLMELNKTWKSFLNRILSKEIDKFREYVYPTYVCSCLRKTKTLYKLADAFLHEMALSMEFISYNINQTVFEVDEEFDNKAFMMVVLKGLLIVSNNSTAHKELKRYETFYFTPKLSAKTKIIAKSQTIIGLASRNIVEEIEAKYYTEKKIQW